MLKLVSINNSYKKILAHSININGKKISKGKIIEKSDIKLLNNFGKKKSIFLKELQSILVKIKHHFKYQSI